MFSELKNILFISMFYKKIPASGLGKIKQWPEKDACYLEFYKKYKDEDVQEQGLVFWIAGS
jgi:hypothetical protein